MGITEDFAQICIATVKVVSLGKFIRKGRLILLAGI